jgi:pyruvate dehydrogenase E1 component alpha subunit
VACFFGDGAATEGIFHEALNLAALWQLPLLFVCENNQWQALVPRREAMAADQVAPWAAGHGIAHRTVDGNDVRAVREAALAARAHIALTGQPYLLETWTYRQNGHYSGDDGAHIDPAERSAWRMRDPIDRLAAQLGAEGRLDEARLKALRDEANQRIAAAQAQAAAAPETPAGELLTDVYA